MYGSLISRSILLVVVTGVSSSDNKLVVETPFGKLRGKEVTAYNGQTYFSFTGIPYAKPPIGDLRFAKPEPHPPLDGVFDATKNAVYCAQMGSLLKVDPPIGQEDCLVLDIHIKTLNTEPQETKQFSASTSRVTDSERPSIFSANEKKKVLVWIHGGNFLVGGATDYPVGTFVTTQDVIFVNVNYRLGIFGFLSTEDVAAPGNYGLWDQLLAIRWVKDNIASFGGDPDDITIVGESAGGASVSMLAISPTAQGLFTKVLPMSGTATSGFALTRHAQDLAKETATAARCYSGDSNEKLSLEKSQEVIKCLRQLPEGDVLNLNKGLLDRALFTPRVDGELLPLNPFVLINDDAYLESVGFFNRTYFLTVDNNEKTIIDMFHGATAAFVNSLEGNTEEEKNAILSSIEKSAEAFYAGSRLLIDSPPTELVDKISEWYGRRISGQSTTEMITDVNFLLPTYDFLNAMARSRDTEAYFMYLNYFPSFMKGNPRGVGHAVELLFWFDRDLAILEELLLYGMAGELNEEDLQYKALLSDIIGQFVKTGNPWNGLKEELPGGWPVFDIQGNHYLDLSLKPTIRRHLQSEKRDFWLSTVPRWVARV